MQLLNPASSTRCSASCGVAHPVSDGPAMLVRIYPVDGPEPPVELGEQSTLVGRDHHCTLVLPDDSVSRRHALIECLNGRYLLSDPGSTNGTYVNEIRINGSHELKAGDRIRFGNQIFKFLSSDRLEAQYHEVIFRIMTTDGLTSAFNRRYLMETLERDLQQSHQTNTSLSLLMMDLDRFKSINDQFGHLAGDAVLVEFARRTRSLLRSGDFLARYGGEEFAVVLGRTGLAEALQTAERIRERIEAEPVLFEDQIIPITVSVGVVCHDPNADAFGLPCCEQTCDAVSLLAEADRLLYAAKKSGRNQVQWCTRSDEN